MGVKNGYVASHLHGQWVKSSHEEGLSEYYTTNSA